MSPSSNKCFGFEGMVASVCLGETIEVYALCCLADCCLCLLLALCSSLSRTRLASEALMPALMSERQLVLLLAIVYRFSGATWHEFRSCLQTSLYLNFGQPLDLDSDDNWPYKMSLGIQPSSMWYIHVPARVALCA